MDKNLSTAGGKSGFFFFSSLSQVKDYLLINGLKSFNVINPPAYIFCENKIKEIALCIGIIKILV